MPFFSLGKLLRLQIRVAQLLTSNQVLGCLQRLEAGRHEASPMESASLPAIDLLQNMRQTCTSDREYYTILLAVLTEANAAAASELVKNHVESISNGDDRDLAPFVVSDAGALSYARSTTSPSNAQRFNSLLTRLSDHIGPTNLRIMAQTSPLDENVIDQVKSVDDLFRLLVSIRVIGPDNVQLLMDWFEELHLDGCQIEVLEYWTTDCEKSESEPPVASTPSAPSALHAELYVELPRSVRYAEPEDEERSPPVSRLYPELPSETTDPRANESFGDDRGANVSSQAESKLGRKRQLHDPVMKHETSKRFKEEPDSDGNNGDSSSDEGGYESAKESIGEVSVKSERNEPDIDDKELELEEEKPLILQQEETDTKRGADRIKDERESKEEEEESEAEEEEEEEEEETEEIDSKSEANANANEKTNKPSLIGPFIDRVGAFLGWK